MSSSRRSTSSRQPGRQVRRDPAGADVVVVHPQAGDLLEEPERLLALAPAVQHHRHRAHVHAVGGEEQQVRGDAVQLAHEHPDPGGPRRELDLEELLGGQREHQLVEQRGRVVHAGDVGRALEVREDLAGLLHAGVEVADDRLRAQHGLAVELEHEPQDAVGAGVLRPHVDDRRLGLVRVGVGQLRPRRPPRAGGPMPSSRSTSTPPSSRRRAISCSPSEVWLTRSSISSTSAGTGGRSVVVIVRPPAP